jgi:hypothetical protein
LFLCWQALTLTAVRKDDKADLSLRSVYNYGNYGLTAVFNTTDKVNVTATIDKVGAQGGGVPARGQGLGARVGRKSTQQLAAWQCQEAASAA